MPGQIYTSRPGDEEELLKYAASFKTKEDAEILRDCEGQKKIGIAGVHQQALYLLALRKVMLERLGESPILLEDEVLIKFRELSPGEIEKRDRDRRRSLHQKMLSAIVKGGYQNLNEEERAYWNSVY